jgi:hypothetical protein
VCVGGWVGVCVGGCVGAWRVSVSVSVFVCLCVCVCVSVSVSVWPGIVASRETDWLAYGMNESR